ncbi:VanZ family protein [Yinghuangia sp. YIM S09857]|uniref:VanZ family protein n=1 Tax=Yinghuangia sp. YIM S09857 TaxID=3436929 RepID=UPI003F52C2D6
MRQVWESWDGILLVWAVAVPVVVGACVPAVRLRIRRGRPPAEALRFTVAEAGIVLGTLPWVWMILTPVYGERGVSAVPLRDLAATLASTPADVLVQVGANLAVFVPLGFLLPLRCPAFAGAARMALVGAAASLALETAQYVLDMGRVSSVDDVLMNAAGAAAGALLSQVHVARRESARSYGDRIAARLLLRLRIV